MLQFTLFEKQERIFVNPEHIEAFQQSTIDPAKGVIYMKSGMIIETVENVDEIKAVLVDYLIID